MRTSERLACVDRCSIRRSAAEGKRRRRGVLPAQSKTWECDGFNATCLAELRAEQQ
jgi:hypothetical protein